MMDRFWAKVYRVPAPNGCWVWRGALISNGYGQYRPTAGRRLKAHRVAYELLVGPIPDGLELDHLCRVRACVNPAHLEPVAPAENASRGRGSWTHCAAGHAYTPENTRIAGDGSRRCVTCRRRSRIGGRQPRNRVDHRAIRDGLLELL